MLCYVVFSLHAIVHHWRRFQLIVVLFSQKPTFHIQTPPGRYLGKLPSMLRVPLCPPWQTHHRHRTCGTGTWPWMNLWYWCSLVAWQRTQIHWSNNLQRSRTHGQWTHWSRDKMDAISQTTFSNAFYWMKFTNFEKYFTEVCSWGFNQQYSSIGSDNGLAPTRRQAIIWSRGG